MTLPKSTKLIVTGVGFVNEYFNIFAAKKMLQNSKYINLQHGNSYHTIMLMILFSKTQILIA